MTSLLSLALRKRLLVAAALLACCKAVAHNDTTPPNAERARSVLRNGIESKDPDVRVQTILAASMIGRNERLLEPLQR